jgi:ubiquinone/menaquinone biosynthesis C-methylase UbiE
LNQLAKGESLSFFDSNMFDAVSVCFGYKYPEDIVSVMREFFRILKPGGSLLFFEAEGHEFPKYVKRGLDSERFRAELMSVGFKSVRISLNRRYLPPGLMDQIDPIWHVRAVK